LIDTTEGTKIIIIIIIIIITGENVYGAVIMTSPFESYYDVM